MIDDTAPVDLPDDMRRWPARARYAVAALERRRVERDKAKKLVREIWAECGEDDVSKLLSIIEKAGSRLQHASGVYLDAGDAEGSEAVLRLAQECLELAGGGEVG